MGNNNRRTVKFVTLGCKLNFSETATIGELLAKHGIVPARDDEAPTMCVVNTCSVTEMADKKGRQHIRSLVKKYPDALMVVTGCYAQLKSEEIAALPGVDIVLGSEQKLDIVDYVEKWLETGRQEEVVVTPHTRISKFSPSCERGDRTRYWLKVQDGCNYYCTYCTIPMARGRSRSGTIESLVAQARQVADEGGKEIVIAGVNIGDFGTDTGERFIDLIKAFDQVEGIERYRISSIEPDLLTDEIIEFCAGSRAFMPHFHIPLQCGSDKVLALMRRRYDTALFRHKIEKVKALIPDAFIGIDLIVGARGETDECFAESLAFCRSLPISRLHVFVYSERPGTRALELDGKVSPETAHKRTQQMLRLSEEKLRDFMQGYVGQVRPALLEHAKAGHPMSGFTDNYIRIQVDAPAQLDNTIVNVRLDAVTDDGEAMRATLVTEQ